MVLPAWVLGGPLVLAPAPADDSRVDAFFQEWLERPVMALDQKVEGVLTGDDDLGGTVQVSYDAERVYVAAQVRDDLFQPGTPETGDGLELRFGPRRVKVVLGQLELGIPARVTLDGKAVTGAEIQGTTRRDGWAVELALPRRVLPALDEGLAFAAVVRDADADAVTAEAVVATHPLGPEGVPAGVTLHFDAHAGLIATFREERGNPEILASRSVDLVGDALPERVLVTPTDVAVLGHLPEGSGYLYFAHGWRGEVTVDAFELRELDGRPGLDLWIEHTENPAPGEYRLRCAEIYAFHQGELRRLFAAELEQHFLDRGGSAVSRPRIEGGARGRAARIIVPVATVTGLNPGNWFAYEAPGAATNQPLPLPWSEPGGPATYVRGEIGWSRR